MAHGFIIPNYLDFLGSCKWIMNKYSKKSLNNPKTYYLDSYSVVQKKVILEEFTKYLSAKYKINLQKIKAENMNSNGTRQKNLILRK